MKAVHHTQRCLEYTMNLSRLKIHVPKNQHLCEECGIAIEVDDRIVRTYSASGKTRLFHKACAEELNII